MAEVRADSVDSNDLSLTLGSLSFPPSWRERRESWPDLVRALSTSIFPGDVIVDILSRLPVKSLIRFLCVCKTWYFVVKDKSFCITHQNYNKKMSILFDGVKFIDQMTPSISSPELQLPEDLTIPLFPVNPSPRSSMESQFTILHGEDLSEPNYLGQPVLQACGIPDIIGTVDGLVCLVQHSTHIILWNPATRQTYQVPSPLKFPEADVCSFTFGFGLDLSTTHNYKIVRITQKRWEKPHVEIYDYNKNSWRLYSNPDPLPWSLFRLRCNVILNGLPYWRAIEAIPGGVYYRELIVAFATCCDTFRVIELPAFEADERLSWKLGVIGKSLAILVQNPQQMLEIFMLHECGWKKAFSIYTMVLGVDRWLGCLSNGKLVAETLSGDLIMYSPSNDEIKYLPARGLDLCSDEVFEYMESLVTPCSGFFEREF